MTYNEIYKTSIMTFFYLPIVTKRNINISIYFHGWSRVIQLEYICTWVRKAFVFPFQIKRYTQCNIRKEFYYWIYFSPDISQRVHIASYIHTPLCSISLCRISLNSSRAFFISFEITFDTLPKHNTRCFLFLLIPYDYQIHKWMTPKYINWLNNTLCIRCMLFSYWKTYNYFELSKSKLRKEK